ncbi:MAG: type II toxin-antitoxin system Phd/YefM family antitoxin [Propioniciclava sp.]
MPKALPIHEVKNRLSSVIAEIAATGDVVEVTRHGTVVAILSAPPSSGVILGLGGGRGDVQIPSVDDLAFSHEELNAMAAAPIDPSA